jgi:hypothetical protein
MRTNFVQFGPLALHPLQHKRRVTRQHTITKLQKQIRTPSPNFARAKHETRGETHRRVILRRRPLPSRHDRFNLNNSAGAQREIDNARICNGHDILEPHAAESSEALQHSNVEETAGGGVGQSGLQQRLHEVATRLDGENHACLQSACRAQLSDALWRALANIRRMLQTHAANGRCKLGEGQRGLGGCKHCPGCGEGSQEDNRQHRECPSQ